VRLHVGHEPFVLLIAVAILAVEPSRAGRAAVIVWEVIVNECPHAFGCISLLAWGRQRNLRAVRL
jgi:hypothetical protein